MKTLTVVPHGGLANRIYVITSATGFCSDNHLSLKVIWFRDMWMGAYFYSLFIHFIQIKREVKIIDAKWYHYIYDRPRKRNLWMPLFSQYLIFGKRRIYDLVSKEQLYPFLSIKNNLYVTSCRLFYEWEGQFNVLYPKSEIMDRIGKITCHFTDRQVIGIHIRRTDHTIAIAESPTHLFLDKIKREISQNAEIYFYLATDSEDVKKSIVQEFGDKIITSPVNLKRDSENGVADALTELYILSNTSKIYGTSRSTFSELAAKIRKIPLEIVSIVK